MDSDVNRLILHFHPDRNDNLKPSQKYSMGKKTCQFTLPVGISPKSIHPDHIGLVAIMLCAPFANGILELPLPISGRFQEATRVLSRFKVGPSDSGVEPYIPSEISRPALSFSGGVDSMAALALMPEETVCVFLEREMKKKSLYNKDAPLRICKELSDLGREIFVIPSDLEYLRDPVGFPVDVANSAPAVLISELMDFNSIGFGTILESAYGIGHERYRHYPDGNHFTTWGTLFRGAGIPLNLVVAGLSEVCTSDLMIRHPLGELAQSCIRGDWGNPCKNCWKCFRKIMLDKVLRGEILEDELLDELFEIKEALHFLSMSPIKHENILTWISSRYEGSHEKMVLMKRRVRGENMSLNWLERWNADSIEVVHESCRDSLLKGISENFQIMDREMKNEMMSWDMADFLESSKYSVIYDDFNSRINRFD